MGVFSSGHVLLFSEEFQNILTAQIFPNLSCVILTVLSWEGVL